MRAGTGGETRVPTEVFLCKVQPFRGGIDTGAAEAIPEFAQCQQEPERYIRGVSAHETKPGG